MQGAVRNDASKAYSYRCVQHLATGLPVMNDVFVSSADDGDDLITLKLCPDKGAWRLMRQAHLNSIPTNGGAYQLFPYGFPEFAG